MRALAVLALLVTLAAFARPAAAQSSVAMWCQTGTTSTGAPIYQPASAANPCPVAAVSTTGAGTLKTGQAVIAVTSTAVQLPANSGLVNGIVVTACNGPSGHTNTAVITVGTSSGLTTTADGSGNGYILQPGSSIGLAVNNSNQVWINGTATDCVSFAGS